MHKRSACAFHPGHRYSQVTQTYLAKIAVQKFHTVFTSAMRAHGMYLVLREQQKITGEEGFLKLGLLKCLRLERGFL